MSSRSTKDNTQHRNVAHTSSRSMLKRHRMTTMATHDLSVVTKVISEYYGLQAESSQHGYKAVVDLQSPTGKTVLYISLAYKEFPWGFLWTVKDVHWLTRMNPELWHLNRQLEHLKRLQVI